MSNLPGGPISARPLHFIFIADGSGSMSGSKIQTLNSAIKEALPHMREVSLANPNAQVLVRAVRFATGAQWHVSQPTKVEDFQWQDLSADGSTDMGKAMVLVADALKTPPMTERALPPVLVLLSDGEPTDDFASGLKVLMEQPWGKKAVRLAIAIGEEANREVLERFMAHPELKPLQANTPEMLVKYIRWASTAVLQAASAPASQARLANGVNVPLPAVPLPSADPTSANDVW
ncbi:MAG TPA: VWA domain-containing protein [Archangium sp.]|jgi:uncharacterized protein YegL|uniref:vWA domain-containing protein n=1 Tax=Archangium sp. TaxID=1872627 RepID=UPI002ED96403